MPKGRPKKGRPKKLDASYSAEVHILGKKYKALGKTLKEVLGNLKPEGHPKTKSILVVMSGDKRKERVLTNIATMRLFSPSPLQREMAIKQTSLLFDL